jgi:DNA-binding MarR family transcriptional regulator
MPSTNATLGSPRSTRAPRVVPETNPAPAGRTAAEDKLWAALHAHPAATTGDLAAHAGIGRSTAGKILAGWATEGSVTRASDPGPGGRRAADTWRITDTTQDQLIAAVAPDHPEGEITGVVPDAAVDIAGEGGSGEITASDPGPGEQPPTSTTPTGAAPPVDGAAPGQSTRLGKGALRGMVEDYLTGRAGEELSPSVIGKALGRSSGAVSNALDKLVADGYAVQTQDKPKRFTAKTVPEPATD